MSIVNPLGTVTRRAGAVTRPHRDTTVPVHYGSAAGELAVCVRAVGLVDRSDMQTFEIAGGSDAVAGVVRAATGLALTTSGCARATGAWWCAASPERVVVLGEAVEAALHAAREGPAAPVTVTDRSADRTVIGLAGAAAGSVLADLGAVSDLRLAPPFGAASIEGVPVDIMLESDRRALLVVDRADARPVWHAIDVAGRPLGLSYVGIEASGRFALLDRLHQRAHVAIAG